MQIGAPRHCSRFPGVGGGGGVRGGSGGQGVFRAPESKWNFRTRETSLVTPVGSFLRGERVT